MDNSSFFNLIAGGCFLLFLVLGAILLELKSKVKQNAKFKTAKEEAIERNNSAGRIRLINNQSMPHKDSHSKYGALQMKVHAKGGMWLLLTVIVIGVFTVLYQTDTLTKENMTIPVFIVGIIVVLCLLACIRTIKFFEYGVVYQGVLRKYMFTYNDVVYIDYRRCESTEEEARRKKYKDEYHYDVYLMNKKRLHWSDLEFSKLDVAIDMYHQGLVDERGETLNKPKAVSFSFKLF